MWNVDASIIGPALLAGVLVLASHVPLGRQVIARGIIFLDLAIAQIAGLGVLLVQLNHWENTLQHWLAYGAAVFAALLLYACERHWPEIQEAIIGVSFILAATAGMLLVAGNPQGGEHVHSLLNGQILWVEYSQLYPIAALYSGLLLLWWLFAKRAGGWLFYLIFAIAITASVQLVGVYLVFASLIIPALAVRAMGPAGLPWAYVSGVCGYTLGLVISSQWDLPAGPVIVWSLAGTALLVRVLRHW